MRVPAQRPTRYRPDQGLLVRQTINQVRDQFGKMADHARHAALCYCAYKQQRHFLPNVKTKLHSFQVRYVTDNDSSN